MADRFPLTVNQSSRKIEEMSSGDNLDLTGNGIAISGSTGTTGQYLKSDGGVVTWDNPGDVYLTATQTVANKVFDNCTLSGSDNIFTNIPNSALVNSSINLNGSTVSLGGSLVTPNDNTTYTISAVDAVSASEKIIRLTAGGSGSGFDDVKIAVGSPTSVAAGSQPLALNIGRVDDTITISGTVVDNNTITTLNAPGGSAQSGDINFTATNAAAVTMTGTTINIDATDTDTITKLRVGTSATLTDGDFTFLEGGATTITQAASATPGEIEITISSDDTITRVQGGGTGSYQSGDILIEGGTHRDSSVSVVQSGNTIQIDAYNDDTITRLASTASNGTFALASGDFRFTASGDAELTQTTNSGTGLTTIDIGFTNTDTGANLGADNGIVLNGSNFELKNASSITDQTLVKWDSANGQLVNSILSDNGSALTVNGDLNVTGTTTTIQSTVLQVADPIIELRKGASLTGADGGIQINRTSNADGVVQTWIGLQWYESGGYFRTIDNGGVARRLVTETETQTLSNKTFSSPTFTGTTNVGIITATTLNGLTVSPCVNSTFDIADSKTLTISNTLTFKGTDGTSIDFGNGGSAGSTVAYTSNTLGSFASTTSTQLRDVLSDSTGIGSAVFAQTPTFVTAINTSSATMSVFNGTATTINFAGSAATINIGATSGTTTIKHDLTVDGSVTINDSSTDTFLVNGIPNFENSDIKIRGSSADPLTVGRGGSAVATNTAYGVLALSTNQGGSQCTAIGYKTLEDNTSGNGNTAVGDRALTNMVSGDNNTGVGKDAIFNITTGDFNTALGNGALFGNTQGSDNVCIGSYAGYNCSGSGNVLIGSASIGVAGGAPIGVTYAPPVAGGDNQLVIGSGSSAWIKGDNSFNVTLPGSLTVNGETTIEGNLTVNGTTTTINVQNIQIDDNAIELAAVAVAEFAGNVVDGSATVSNVDNLTGIIVGMNVNVKSGTSILAGTTVVSVDTTGNSIVLSNPVSGAGGTAVFEAIGPTDLAANGGGLILKGSTTNKTILYDNTRTDKYWTFSENLEIKAGKKIAINGNLLIDGTSLGSSVVSSNLTSVGTLLSLGVSGEASFGGRVKESNDNQFNTTLTPSSNVLTINTATSNTICGTPAAQAINEWAFTNVNLSTGQTYTVTLILDSNTSAIYGDACTVDGVSISNGVEWSGGSPPTATNNTDILTFIIVRDSAGTTRVFGQGNTDFS